MSWFPDAASVRNWASRNFRHPYTRETFFEDLHWGRMPTWCLRGDGDELLAFGQFYERFGRANFARVAVNPSCRGRGFGREFIRLLLVAAGKQMPLDEAGLFVYRDNAAAIRCYEAAGFGRAAYPDGAPYRDECWYMTAPLR